MTSERKPRELVLVQYIDPVFRDRLIIMGDACSVVSLPPQDLAADPSGMMSRQQVAKWLGVSVRWVERHVTPLAQKSRRGRAWYSASDVQRQIVAFTVKKTEPVVAIPARSPPRPAMSGRMARAVTIGDALRRKNERR